MAIILEQSVLKYLLDFLNKYNSSWWMHKKVIGALENQLQEWAEIKKCKHIKGKYMGKKTCCTKCGSYFKKGMGFKWQLD